MQDNEHVINDKAAFDKDKVVKIINSVLMQVQKSDSEIKTALQKELLCLHEIIQELRGEISSIRTQDIKDEHIPVATDELDAVVEATEEATSTIMDSVENIEKVAESMQGDASAKIADEVVKIYEACSFQDITGQRITKVINAIQGIEVKVDQLMTVLDTSFPGALEQTPEKDDRADDPDKLEGPALPGQKVSQDDIDAILAEFDD